MSDAEEKPRCSCDWLDAANAEPDVPIRFDPRTNEYSLVYANPEGERRLIIYYCPFCGGAAPESTRGSMFARVTDAEIARLKELLASVDTIDDALRVLGPPDEDMPAGSGSRTAYNPDKPQVFEEFRTLRYEHLSESVVVDVQDRPGRRVGVSYAGKYIGPRPSNG